MAAWKFTIVHLSFRISSRGDDAGKEIVQSRQYYRRTTQRNTAIFDKGLVWSNPRLTASPEIIAPT